MEHRKVVFCSQYYTMHYTYKPSDTKLITIFTPAVYRSLSYTRQVQPTILYTMGGQIFQNIYHSSPQKFSGDHYCICIVVNSTSYDTHRQGLCKYNSTHITRHAATSLVFNIGISKVLLIKVILARN
jgi:hypothetical protein